MGTPGAPELLILLVIVLLILGPKRLPALGRQVGGGLREFKDAITGSGRPDGHGGEDRRTLDGGADAPAAPANGPAADTPAQRPDAVAPAATAPGEGDVPVTPERRSP